MSKQKEQKSSQKTKTIRAESSEIQVKSTKEIKEAVVLLNMGGANSLFEVELFLRNMFADPLILRIKNSFIRKFVANIIINARLDKLKANYQAIGSKSPLVEITYNLTQTLSKIDNSRFYTYAMRYTPPYARNVVADLKERGIQKITLFSMYPQ